MVMKSSYKYLIVCLLCLVAHSVSAQIPSGVFAIEKEKVVCDNYATPLRLDVDILELSLSSGGGTWYEVNPADHNDIISSDISNIFMAISRMPGEYHFVFVSKNNPCLADGEKALAKITITENVESLSTNVLLCPNDAPLLELKDFVAPAHRNLTLEFKDEQGNVLTNGQYNVNSTFTGDINLEYNVTDVNFICANTGNLTLIVSREEPTSNLPLSGQVAYCKDAVANEVNLNTLLNYTIDGTWSAVAVNGITGPQPTDNIVDLSAINISSYPVTYKYELTLSSSSCYSFASPTVEIVITDDLSSEFADVSYDVCKTTAPSGYLDLMQILGIGVPVNSGEWSPVDQTSPVDVMDGVFELADARSGVYTYNFKVSDAIELCAIQGQEANVTINVFDNSEALDGEVQVCAGTSSGSINLSEYIIGLPATGVNWYKGNDATGTVIATGDYPYSDLNNGTQVFTYSFDSGVCGASEGRLYVTVGDIITNFIDKEIKYCLSDNGSDNIDLDQILGVAGVPGTWTLDTQNSTSDQTNTGNYDSTTHTFDGRAAAAVESTAGEGTYVFTYTVDSNYNGCIPGGSTVTITVTITGDLTN